MYQLHNIMHLINFQEIFELKLRKRWEHTSIYISTTNYTVNQKNNNTEKETWNRYCKSNFICDDIISQFTRFKLVCSHYSFRDQDVDCCKFLLKCEEFNIRLKLREAVSWILKILLFFIGHNVNYMKLC